MNKKSESNQKIAILGCSGWIGSFLAPALCYRINGTSLIGTYSSKCPTSLISAKQLPNQNSNAIIEFLERAGVTSVVNLTRGEQEADFLLHKRLIEFGNMTGAHYFYASSFNACDAQLIHDHQEFELPSAQSEYGKFKARCEKELFESSKRFAIFRFSATHGWAPNRVARTEEFLLRLKTQVPFTVNKGIIQNRTAVTQLAAMMAAVIDTKCEGVFHLGSIEPSDEVDFCKRLALAFGYDPEIIVEGENSPTNAFMVPDKILQLFGAEFRFTETDAIAAVSNMQELQSYKMPGSLK